MMKKQHKDKPKSVVKYGDYNFIYEKSDNNYSWQNPKKVLKENEIIKFKKGK